MNTSFSRPTHASKIRGDSPNGNLNHTHTIGSLLAVCLMLLAGCNDSTYESSTRSELHHNNSSHGQDDGSHGHGSDDETTYENGSHENGSHEDVSYEHSHDHGSHGEGSHAENSAAEDSHSEDAHGEGSYAEDFTQEHSGQHATSDDHNVVPQEGMLGQATALLGSAKERAASAANGVTAWTQDTIGGVAEAGSQSAADTMAWANRTFESLKSRGLTTADNTSQWLTQDWNNMESWEYKIETKSGSDVDLAVWLGEQGSAGWECFQVLPSPTGDGERYFLKKPRFSYLRHMPFRDFIKLAPLINQGAK